MSERTLQDQLEEVEAELRNEHQRGALMDSGKVAELAERRQELNTKISVQAQAEREQAIEERVHSEITFAIPGVDFTKLPVELINVIHLVVKSDRRRIIAEHAIELEQIENEFDAYKQNAEGNYNGLLANHNQLEQEYEACARELKEQTEETVRLIAERDDARKNRDNAAAQYEEAKAEIERLKGQIDDYQKAKVYGEREAQSIIDVTPNEAEEINEAIKLFVSSENWGSTEKLYLPDGTFKVVKRSELSEWQLSTPPTLGGSETLPETFQGETAEGDVSDSGVSDSEAAGIDFRQEEESTTAGLDEHESVSEGDAPVTRREFQELSARVSQLEQSQRIVA
ncbi:hypothetical protein [Paenibacillus harenae]|uniref:hypothetical protein n=1 Tax=Paenibacillus harenae TaxID=306543 RepID=UPI000427009D|nr:hypothetical protein [Paenibacillus harenae]